MSFDEINLVVPYLETADAYGYGDLYDAQPFAPQMFKTHFWYNHVPKGAGKYITVVRQEQSSNDLRKILCLIQATD